jgi:hypothetical protein
LVAALALFASSLTGQERPSPERQLAEAFRADSLNDWRGLLRIIHPQSLADMKRSLMDQIARGTFEPNENPDTCFARLETEFNHFMIDSVFRVRHYEAFTHLSPDTIFARARRAYTLQRDHPIPDWVPTDRRILGSFAANDTLAYVIVNEHLGRVADPDAPRDRARVYTALAFQGAWRLLDVDILDIPGSFSFAPTGECREPRSR